MVLGMEKWFFRLRENIYGSVSFTPPVLEGKCTSKISSVSLVGKSPQTCKISRVGERSGRSGMTFIDW